MWFFQYKGTHCLLSPEKACFKRQLLCFCSAFQKSIDILNVSVYILKFCYSSLLSPYWTFLNWAENVVSSSVNGPLLRWCVNVFLSHIRRYDLGIVSSFLEFSGVESENLTIGIKGLGAYFVIADWIQQSVTGCQIIRKLLICFICLNN